MTVSLRLRYNRIKAMRVIVPFRQPRTGSRILMAARCSGKDLECAIARTASLICGRWTLLILRDLAASPQRFCTLERSLEGISPNTLVERLRTLEEEHIITRRAYAEIPPRVEYALTEKGTALVPVLEMMRDYGERWLSPDDVDAGEPILPAGAVAVK